MGFSLPLAFMMCPLNVEMNRAFPSFHPARASFWEGQLRCHVAADKAPGETTKGDIYPKSTANETPSERHGIHGNCDCTQESCPVSP